MNKEKRLHQYPHSVGNFYVYTQNLKNSIIFKKRSLNLRVYRNLKPNNVKQANDILILA